MGNSVVRRGYVQSQRRFALCAPSWLKGDLDGVVYNLVGRGIICFIFYFYAFTVSATVSAFLPYGRGEKRLRSAIFSQSCGVVPLSFVITGLAGCICRGNVNLRPDNSFCLDE